jgi:hypothetical protein
MHLEEQDLLDIRRCSGRINISDRRMHGLQSPNYDPDDDDYLNVRRGGENIAPYVLNLDTSWRYVVSYMPVPSLYLSIFFIWFVRLLALRPLLAYCASLG